MEKGYNTPDYHNYLNLDELLNAWRYKHHLLANRMNGKKIGTRGSVGAQYLKKALTKHRAFDDLSGLNTFLISIFDLTVLPGGILQNLSFHYNIYIAIFRKEKYKKIYLLCHNQKKTI